MPNGVSPFFVLKFQKTNSKFQFRPIILLKLYVNLYFWFSLKENTAN